MYVYLCVRVSECMCISMHTYHIIYLHVHTTTSLQHHHHHTPQHTHTHTTSTEASRRAFYKEFVKVVDAADVIIQVLDARDPLAFRCAEVERFIRGKDPNKRIVLLLNKIGVCGCFLAGMWCFDVLVFWSSNTSSPPPHTHTDLVPREVVTAWLKYFKEELPTVAFKCSTQQQATRLAQKRGKAAGRSKGGGGGGGSSGGGDVVEGGSGAVGAEQLLQLLKNYARNKNIKTAVTVGMCFCCGGGWGMCLCSVWCVDIFMCMHTYLALLSPLLYAYLSQVSSACPMWVRAPSSIHSNAPVSLQSAMHQVSHVPYNKSTWTSTSSF